MDEKPPTDAADTAAAGRPEATNPEVAAEPPAGRSAWARVKAGWGRIDRVWKVVGTVVSIVTFLGGAIKVAETKTDRGRIRQAVHELTVAGAADTLAAWEKNLAVLNRVPDSPDEYRAAAVGLMHVVRTKLTLDYGSVERPEHACAVGIDRIRRFRQAMPHALRTLSALARRIELPVVLDSIDLRQVNVQDLEVPELYLRGACLRDVDLSGLRARVADFSRSNLETTTLARAIIGYARFDGVRADGLSLEGAVVDSARFFSAQITGAVFARASLPFTDFSNANIDDAVLTRTCLYGGNFGGTRLGRPSLWEEAVYARAYLGNTAGAPPNLLQLAARQGAVTQPLENQAAEDALRAGARTAWTASERDGRCRTTAEARAALRAD